MKKIVDGCSKAHVDNNNENINDSNGKEKSFWKW